MMTRTLILYASCSRAPSARAPCSMPAVTEKSVHSTDNLYTGPNISDWDDSTYLKYIGQLNSSDIQSTTFDIDVDIDGH